MEVYSKFLAVYDTDYWEWVVANNTSIWGDMNISHSHSRRSAIILNNGHCSMPYKFRHVCSICSCTYRRRDCLKCRKR